MSDDRGPALLALARASLAAALAALDAGRAKAPSLTSQPAWLQETGATFVTLLAGGALRGCIGTLEAFRPLAEDVWENARAAALRDPRFPPLTRLELPGVRIEVSLLTAPVPLDCRDGETAVLGLLRPGRDGVIFTCGTARSTFLPQVWEQLPEPRRFLAQLKAKAGLNPDFWSPEVRLSTYEVMKWQEAP